MLTENQNKTLAIIDFETLSTHQNAQVLSLGITYFKAGVISTITELAKNTKSWNFDLSNQIHRHVKESTREWWTEQNPITWTHHRTEPLLQPREILHELKAFVAKNNIEYIVGNGIGFDNVLLKNLCEDYNVPYPVEYWGDLDLRTIRWLTTLETPEFPQQLTKHVAEHDCIAEAIMFQKMFLDIKS